MAGPPQAVRFLWEFVKHPLSTGAIASSSGRLARAITSGVGLEGANAVVELGAGTGAFTRQIIERARPDAEILVLESNPTIASMLRENMPGLDVVVDSAANLGWHLKRRGIRAVDCVICGLPWASFRAELQDDILGAVAGSMAPGGRFATFAYVHACWMGGARRFRGRLADLFAEVEASPVVWLNLPPAFVWRCTR